MSLESGLFALVARAWHAPVCLSSPGGTHGPTPRLQSRVRHGSSHMLDNRIARPSRSRHHSSRFALAPGLETSPLVVRRAGGPGAFALRDRKVVTLVEMRQLERTDVVSGGLQHATHRHGGMAHRARGVSCAASSTIHLQQQPIPAPNTTPYIQVPRRLKHAIKAA